MDIKVDTNISKEFNEINININAPELTDDLQKIINNLVKISSQKDEIVATKNNEIFLIKTKDVFYFYSDEKSNYCKTKTDTYRVKEKLYELENELSKNKFIRISNSCIVNIDQVVCFDVSKIGSLVVKMQDNTRQEVSKRRIKNVMKFLNERK